jgi:hypothetical protein
MIEAKEISNFSLFVYECFIQILNINKIAKKEPAE